MTEEDLDFERVCIANVLEYMVFFFYITWGVRASLRIP